MRGEGGELDTILRGEVVQGKCSEDGFFFSLEGGGGGWGFETSGKEYGHSSLLPLAWDSGCTVGPGAVGWLAGGGGAVEVLVVVVGFESGVLEGYFRRVEEEAADRAALEEEAPIGRRLVGSLFDEGELRIEIYCSRLSTARRE